MLKGLPGSGKTEWANKKLQLGGYVRISAKDLRQETLGSWSVKKEKACLRMRDELAKFAIKEGKNAIIDDYNLNPKHEYRLRSLAESLGVQFIINDEFLKLSPEECIQNDLHRGKDAVGAGMIYELYEKWVRPNPTKVLKQKDLDRRCIIVDLDGTLSMRVSDRSWYDMTRVAEDAPNPLMSFLVDCMNECGEYYTDVVIVSGREETGRKETERWLKNNCIDYKALYMRKEGDRRRDDIVKEEILVNKILPKYAVLGVIDDSMNCCSMYYSYGITTLKAGNPRQEK